MYGVPGGMYITPQQHQQQPRPNHPPAMFNRIGAMPPQGIPLGMGPQLGNPHPQGLMQRQQQQQQQVRLNLCNVCTDSCIFRCVNMPDCKKGFYLSNCG